MKNKTHTYLALPDQVRRMAGMAAARASKSLSEYVADLVVEDCRRTGVAALVLDTGVSNPDSKEVQS